MGPETACRYPFVVLTDWSSAAVLDRETGLVWEQSPATFMLVWDSAFVFCLQKEVGGRKGWHLPMLEQLASLTDSSNTNPALPTGHPFTNVQSGVYWSATTQGPRAFNALPLS